MCKGNYNQNNSANTGNLHHSVKFYGCIVVVSLKNSSESDKINMTQFRRTIATHKKEERN